jgi:nifR3 family TIM-barrel protein
MYTEFISADGLVHDADKSFQKLDIFDYERPIGIQYFGGHLENMIAAAHIVEQANPDVIDINYGCPVAKVACRMAGAGLLQDIPKMITLTQAVVKSTNKPVTVKTRLGWDEQSINIVEVAERLQDIGIAALTIHGRTRKQMYKGEANWEHISAVKNNQRMHIPIFGNGDIDSPEKAVLYKNRYDVDGMMIGRASIGYPWIFNEIKALMFENRIAEKPDIGMRVSAAKSHLLDAIAWKGEKLGILETRRHYTNYFKGLPDIKIFRSRLVVEDNKETLLAILDEISETYSEYANFI